MKNSIYFYNDPDENRFTIASVYLKGNRTYPIQDFLRGDIQIGKDSCSEWLDRVNRAKEINNYFYDSFGNCCTTTVTHQGVTIENEYTGDIVKNISLDDMQIILEKWLEFIINREPIEFSW